MRWLVLLGLTAATAYVVLPPKYLALVGVDKPYLAEDFTVTDLEGNSMSLSDCLGKPTLLYIWATWCPASQDQVAMMDALYQTQYPGVCFMAVSDDKGRATAMKSFAHSHTLLYPIYDGYDDLPDSYWTPRIPRMFLIDGKGYVRKITNSSYYARKEIEDYLEELKIDAVDLDAPDDAPAAAAKAPLVDDDKEVLEMEKRTDRLLASEAFGALDEDMEKVRSGKERTSVGRNKLRQLYHQLGADALEGSGEKILERITLLDRWVAARPDSITARSALADSWVRYAWQARGHGTSDTVTDKMSDLFHERLAKAREIVDAADGLTQKCPHLYAVAEQIALGQSDRRYLEWAFARGTLLDPGYDPLYVAKANFLTPWWGGRPGEFQQFALASEGDGPREGMLARIVWAHEGTFEWWKTPLFESTSMDWNKVAASFDKLEKRYPNNRERVNEFLRLAVFAKDLGRATEAIKRIGGKPDKNVWKDLGKYRYWKRRLLTPNLKERVVRWFTGW